MPKNKKKSKKQANLLIPGEPIQGTGPSKQKIERDQIGYMMDSRSKDGGRDGHPRLANPLCMAPAACPSPMAIHGTRTRRDGSSLLSSTSQSQSLSHTRTTHAVDSGGQVFMERKRQVWVLRKRDMAGRRLEVFQCYVLLARWGRWTAEIWLCHGSMTWTMVSILKSSMARQLIMTDS
jgi:hypothetical protein